MPALALKNNFKRVGIRGGVAGHKADRANIECGLGMKRIEFINSETLNQTVFNHVPGSGKTFFSGLENRNQGAGKMTMLHEILHHSQKCSHVTVMPAGMHMFGTGACVGHTGIFI